MWYAVCNFTEDEMQEALRPISSLMSKSKKAQQKLMPGTWQHTMLNDNIKALRYASVLISRWSDDGDQPERDDMARKPTQDDIQEYLRALAKMIDKTEKTQARFLPGTSQHTLQRNRLKALRIAEALIEAELDKG